MKTLSAYVETLDKPSKAAVAEHLGVSRPYLYGLLDGTRQPSLEVAQRIARATDGAVPITAWPNIAAILEAAKAA